MPTPTTNAHIVYDDLIEYDRQHKTNAMTDLFREYKADVNFGLRNPQKLKEGGNPVFMLLGLAPDKAKLDVAAIIGKFIGHGFLSLFGKKLDPIAIIKDSSAPEFGEVVDAFLKFKYQITHENFAQFEFAAKFLTLLKAQEHIDYFKCITGTGIRKDIESDLDFHINRINADLRNFYNHHFYNVIEKPIKAVKTAIAKYNPSTAKANESLIEGGASVATHITAQPKASMPHTHAATSSDALIMQDLRLAKIPLAELRKLRDELIQVAEVAKQTPAAFAREEQHLKLMHDHAHFLLAIKAEIIHKEQIEAQTIQAAKAVKNSAPKPHRQAGFQIDPQSRFGFDEKGAVVVASKAPKKEYKGDANKHVAHDLALATEHLLHPEMTSMQTAQVVARAEGRVSPRLATKADIMMNAGFGNDTPDLNGALVAGADRKADREFDFKPRARAIANASDLEHPHIMHH